MEQQGIPIHRGYYIEELRTVELGWWKTREHNAAFIQLEGMRGITEVRVTEIPAGGALPPLKLGFDEVVYVLQGYGITSLNGQGGKDTKSFEWQPHSMFLLPRHYTHQFTNTRGDVPVRLMHFNYMPAGMSGSNNPNFFFNNSFEEPEQTLDQIYSQARVEHVGSEPGMDPYLWYGNFFPDMAAWDKLAELQNRGAGGHHVQFQFPDTEIYGHMSVFEPRLYKKAHRHGPGVAIVIPMGEGFSIMWPEGGEKVVAPWHEGSFFVPPDRWYHQHFNVGGTSARYIAFSASPQFGIWERVRDPNDQIEYPEEEPWIREKFEGELARRGISSLMPDVAYKDRDYTWEPRGSYTAPV
jgi:mannose-6-phosphate isomerase-like protein (cupin superfamily)